MHRQHPFHIRSETTNRNTAMNDASSPSYGNHYQSGSHDPNNLYNNGLSPILPLPTYRSDGRWWHAFLGACPVYVVTYITLHLDTMSKILNHCISISLVGNVLLFISSFSISYYDDSYQNHIGLHTVLCTFLLCVIAIVNLLIINNNRISALSIFAPTEYMIGVATGIAMAAVVILLLLSSTYRSARRLCRHIVSEQQHSDSHNHFSGGSNSTENGYHAYNNDAVLIDTCVHHQSTIVSLWFWSGLLLWFHVLMVVLFVLGRHELSAHTTKHYQQQQPPHNYAPVASSEAPPIDFEEQFRRQQEAILGASNLQALRDRLPLFTGDYATIPEVTPASGPQILSV